MTDNNKTFDEIIQDVKSFNKEDYMNEGSYLIIENFDTMEKLLYKRALKDRATEIKVSQGHVDGMLQAAEQYIKDYHNKKNRESAFEMRPGWHMKDNGTPLAHYENTEKWLQSHSISCRYNLLTNNVEWNCEGTDILEEGETFNQFGENDIVTKIRNDMLLEGYYLKNNEELRNHIAVLSRANSYHPVKDYLERIKDNWDGSHDYIKDEMDRFVLSPEHQENYEMYYRLLRKWFITAVKLIYNDSGTESAQGMLFLKAKQGVGKSRWIESLLPIHSWGKTGVAITSDKDSKIQAFQYWICELGEFSLDKKHLPYIKAFVTMTDDIYRRPYARESEKNPRRTIFVGTTDKDDFLIDEAGERRFWVIPCESILDSDIDIDALWSQVYTLAIENKERHWLTREEIESLNQLNSDFKIRDEYESIIRDAFAWEIEKEKWIWAQPSDIAEDLGIPSPIIVGRVLASLPRDFGIEGVKHKGKRRIRLYKIPPYVDYSLRESAYNRHVCHYSAYK